MIVYGFESHVGDELEVETDTDVDGNALAVILDSGGARRSIRLREGDVQELADALERWLKGER